MGDECQGKNSWPELVGFDGQTAAARIESENPNVNAIVVQEGFNVTTDYRCDRVWVWVSKAGKVTETPIIG
ncbi:hypothetical protein C5167_011576 [Papaver somniferum]|uniref:Proteinase inhibitor n=1 Tax=Papaver somniferum TaxID=3469 RepID=A0A4Y7K6E4_PAPSO|nr:hypothetical protein MKW92_046051 [Papaver armeniacum]KAI3949487.1 hypothetical protein MKW92_042563 [Papaver armeniacum]RZC67902.1 hypothetical protein C5167_011576 [Papaver somniferum]